VHLHERSGEIEAALPIGNEGAIGAEAYGD
jgi:hypothetical protein